MAKVTLVFEDIDDGVSLTVESDPSLPENISDEGNELTDAQKMAISMAMIFDQQMKEAEQEEPHQHQCGSGGGCGGKHQKEGKCRRHEETPPENCCQH